MTPTTSLLDEDVLDVLIVDDNPGDREYVRRVLENDRSLECEFNLCESPREARESYTDNSFDLIVLDYRFPQSDGLKFYSQLKRVDHRPVPPSLLTTAYGDPQLVDRWKRIGGDAYLDKEQVGPNSLHSVISKLITDKQSTSTGSVINTTGEYNEQLFREFLESLLAESTGETRWDQTWYFFFVHIEGLHDALQESLDHDGSFVEEFVNHFVLDDSSEWLFGHYRGDLVWTAAETSGWDDINEAVSTVTQRMDAWLNDCEHEAVDDGFSLCCLSVESGDRSANELFNEINSLIERSTMTPGTSVLIHSGF